MVNIEQITSTLAKLPDQALQRYAQMHKDDPYIMSLAVSESKRRKEMRAAGQGQAQPQPKVVDQALNEMASQQPIPAMPEEQGIGALPAAAQMNFVDGGITGYYADGGQVEQYQDRGLVRPYETVADRYYRETREREQAAQAEREAQAAAIGVTPYGEQMSRMGSAFAGIPGKILSGAKELASNLVSAPGTRGNTMLSDLVGSQSPAAEAAAPVQYDPAQATRRNMYEQASSGENQGEAPRTGANQSLTSSASPSAARTPAAPATSIEDRFLAAQKKMTEQPNPYAADEAAYQAEAMKLAKDKLASVNARQAMFKNAFGGREARLEERAKELENSKDTNTGLAFLEAGLAIMSTPGGLATAIGKGAREGTAKYASGIDKLRSAKDKLDEAKDRMEELKLNRDEMSAKEKAEAELGIQQTVLSGKKDALSSAKTLYGDRSKLSQEILKTTINVEEGDKDRASRDRATAQSAANAKAQIDATLNTPQRLAFQGFLAKTVSKDMPLGDPAKAYQDFMAAAQEPKSIQQLKHDWSTDMMLQNKYKDVNDYIKFMSGSSGTGAPTPSSGKVPPLPSGFKLNG